MGDAWHPFLSVSDDSGETNDKFSFPQKNNFVKTGFWWGLKDTLKLFSQFCVSGA